MGKKKGKKGGGPTPESGPEQQTAGPSRGQQAPQETQRQRGNDPRSSRPDAQQSQRQDIPVEPLMESLSMGQQGSTPGQQRQMPWKSVPPQGAQQHRPQGQQMHGPPPGQPREPRPGYQTQGPPQGLQMPSPLLQQVQGPQQSRPRMSQQNQGGSQGERMPRPHGQRMQRPQGQQMQSHPQAQQMQGFRPAQQMQSTPPQQMQGFRPAQQMQSPPPQQMQGFRPAQQMQSTPPQQMQGPPQGQQRPGHPQQQQSAGAPRQEQQQGGIQDSPKRREGQRSGKPYKVDVNHMELSLKNYDIIAYHYDIALVPDKPKFLLRSVVLAFCKQNFPKRNPVYDGQKNLFSQGPLIEEGGSITREITVMNTDAQREKTFLVTMTQANRIDMSVLRRYLSGREVITASQLQLAIMVLDIALRMRPSMQLIPSGRVFFSPPEGRIVDLGNGLDMWYGFHQSAIMGWEKPFLNVDVVHKGFFRPMSIEEVIETVCREGSSKQELDGRDLDRVSKYLRTLKVDYEIPRVPNSKRCYRINGAMGPASKERFKDDNGTEWTVASYFEQSRGYRLRKPHLPCIWVGSKEKRIRIPGELCTLSPGQPSNRKLDESQTATMVRLAATSTDIRRQKIMKAFRDAGFTNNPYMDEFGISVAGKFQTTDARILNAPALQYLNKEIQPYEGTWRAEKFLQPTGDIVKWAVLSLDRGVQVPTALTFFQMMSKQAKDMGFNMDRPTDVQLRDHMADKKIEEFFSANRGCQIIFVVIPDRFSEVYCKVKRIAELTTGAGGVLTQCIKAKNVKFAKPATVGNILLKVNTKLNGINHTLTPSVRPPCLRVPAMIVGADVTHPSPDQTGIPSVAAVASSHNPNACAYNVEWRLQDPRVEIIQDLEKIMISQLKYFYSKARVKPERIIFYRDGVSEGQIHEVKSVEVQAIRRACKSMPGDYEPSITFLVVQKRHHTRFFPTDGEKDRLKDKRNFNVPAGTVVDRTIVRKEETEFYLLSHASIQGTARPTKYRLVHDDKSYFDEDELEKLTYYLCHLFSRCTRTVSYPAPTYYAHLAAFRVRNYLNDRVDLMNLDREQIHYAIHTQIIQNNPMFFV